MGVFEGLLASFRRQREEVAAGESAESRLADPDNGNFSHIIELYAVFVWTGTLPLASLYRT